MRIKTLIENFYLFSRSLLLSPLLALRKTKIPANDQIRKILLLRHDRIGDMVLSTPVFYALRRGYPNAVIVVLASVSNKEVIKYDPAVNEIIVYQGIWHFLKEFRDKEIDLAIDLFYTYELKSAFLTYIFGARYRMGFENAGRQIFFNIKGPKIKRSGNMIEHLLELVSCLGIEKKAIRPRLYLQEEEKNWAIDYLKENDIDLDKITIALHPGAFFPSQRWPLDNFITLSDKIRDEFGANIIFFGEKDDEALLRRHSEIMGSDRTKLFFDLNLRQFIAVLACCDLLICNNSGPLHIASALEIPTVSVMGPTDPILWSPTGKDDTVIRKNISCSPCSRDFCSRHDCMRLVTVEEVMEVVRLQIKKICSVKDRI
ncbi:MAG: lipopolysaccharide heptosyltransferase II [Candidatus Omnitrophica bacterium]|nr:lipopolysaccharide heptosyltransferase II [Candidatus Omnitrophota bacterium]